MKSDVNANHPPRSCNLGHTIILPPLRCNDVLQTHHMYVCNDTYLKHMHIYCFVLNLMPFGFLSYDLVIRCAPRPSQLDTIAGAEGQGDELIWLL